MVVSDVVEQMLHLNSFQPLGVCIHDKEKQFPQKRPSKIYMDALVRVSLAGQGQG